MAEWLRALIFHYHSKSFDHLYTVSDVGSSPRCARCAGVPGGFSQGSPVFAPPTDWPVSYDELR